MENTITPEIQDLPPFYGLSAGSIRYLQSRLRRYFFSAGDPIVQPGRKGQFMAIVGHGLIDLEAPNGEIKTLLPGQTFGEEMMLSGAESKQKISARTEASLWVLTRNDWLTANQISKSKQKKKSRNHAKQVWLAAFILLIGLVLAFLILSPELPNSIHHSVAETLNQAGRPDLTEVYLSYAAFIQPDSALILDDLGNALFLQGRFGEAVQVFQQSVALDDSSASAHNNLGTALMQINRPAFAIEHLEAASELDPGNADVLYNLGNALLKVGDIDHAVKAYRRSTELDDHQIEAKNNLAALLLEKDQTGDARLLWEQVLAQEPARFEALRGLGMLALYEDRPEEAKTRLQAALTINPIDAGAHLYLGLALKALDQNSAAATEFAVVKMLTSDPEWIDISQALLAEILQSQQ